MRRLLLFIIAIWLLLPATAWSYDLLIVQSQRSPAYDDVLRGLRSVVRVSERMIVLADYNEVDIQRIAREEAPIAIITLGDSALEFARKVRKTPVIALMTLNFRKGMGASSGMTGVTVQLSPDRYLPVFTAIRAKRVGIISNPARNTEYIRQAKTIAADNDIELIVREVKSSKEVSGKLESMAGQVDLLWMLPDSVTSSGEAADAHFHFSARHNVPVVTFSSIYLSSGAAVSVEFDRFDMGKQAGEMALSLLNGNSIADIPAESPRKVSVKNNPSILRRLGLNRIVPSSGM